MSAWVSEDINALDMNAVENKTGIKIQQDSYVINFILRYTGAITI